MYVCVLEYVEHGRHEMIEYLRSVSSESSESAEVEWVMDDWMAFLTGHSLVGFKMSWRDGSEPVDPCPLLFSKDGFNETTQMLGCPLGRCQSRQSSGPIKNAHFQKRRLLTFLKKEFASSSMKYGRTRGFLSAKQIGLLMSTRDGKLTFRI